MFAQSYKHPMTLQVLQQVFSLYLLLLLLLHPCDTSVVKVFSVALAFLS